MYDEILEAIGVNVYLHNKTTPLAVIYTPKFSLAHYLVGVVLSYSEYVLPCPPFEEMFTGEPYEVYPLNDAIYNDPLEEGYPSDLNYEDSYGTIIISRDGDYPEMTIKTVKKTRERKEHIKVQKEKKTIKKSDYLKLAILNLLIIGILAYAYYKGISVMILAVFAILLLIFDLVFINSQKWAEKKTNSQLEGEFTEVFSYFSIFIKNGFPSYSALESVIPFASEKMGERLTNLLAEIDEDKTVMPYIHFGENFKSLEIKQVLIAIYKMSEEGGSEAYIRQFDTLFRALSGNERRSSIDKKKQRLDTLGILPLLGSGIAMMVIIMAVVILLQEMGNYGF